MHGESARAVTGGGEHLAELATEMSQLRDLFQRRLLEDKAKNRLYEDLREQLVTARGGLEEQLLAPLFAELLLVVDRISRLNAHGDAVLASISEELLEVLGRRGVRRVPSTAAFEPAIHEAVRTEVREDCGSGAILEVVRPGYLLGGRLLRPERVVVAVAPSPGGQRPPESYEESTVGEDCP